jgi:hypothetical protein
VQLVVHAVDVAVARHGECLTAQDVQFALERDMQLYVPGRRVRLRGRSRTGVTKICAHKKRSDNLPDSREQ